MGFKPAALFVVPSLLALATAAEARIDAEALVGQPFGIGRVTITGLEAGIDANRVLIEERNGRVLYPAVSPGLLGRVLGQILGDPADRPAAGVTVFFLFRGAEPLELTLFTPSRVPLTVEPVAANPRISSSGGEATTTTGGNSGPRTIIRRLFRRT